VGVTIKDVAHRAGVSHPTVSRALRGDRLVAPKTAARIRRIAADLGYVPSATARSLKTSRSLVIGVIVNRISDPFYSEVLDGIQDVLHSTDYSLFLAATEHDPEREKAVVRAMLERRIDGLIVCSRFVTPGYRMELGASGSPVVVVHNRGRDSGGNAIYHDDHEGSRQMTRHLIDLGHRRIAFVASARAGRESEDRLAGFLAEMETAGLTVSPEYIVQAATGQLTSAPGAVELLLGLARRPTALLCFNDILAIGAMQQLRQRGLQVPADCSVVGFDNISFSMFVIPPLTTFNQPKYPLGQEAARMMLRLLNAKAAKEKVDQPTVITLRGEILVRASSAPPPADDPESEGAVR
jgi:DNA-binding LacI/PurR family transcriptional regulator